MTATHDFQQMISLALEQGYLSAQQIIETCVAFGKSENEGEPLEVEAFWTERGWLSATQLSELEAQRQTLYAQGGSPYKTAEIAPVNFLTTLINTLHQPEHEEGEEDFDDATLQTEYVHHIETKAELRYTLGETLGVGGLGLVREAHDHNLGREVALKVLQPDVASVQNTQLLLEEAWVTSQLEHPNIVPLYDIGVLPNNQVYYTMRLLPSTTLRHLLEQHHNKEEISFFQFVGMLQQICMGLEFAHSRGVIHRDIKPENVILGSFGEVLIVDWGVAKVHGSEVIPYQTVQLYQTPVEHLRGTVPYMAPEVIVQGHLSSAVDQYAVGVILYEYLTGTLPFHADNIYTLIYYITLMQPAPPHERCPQKEIPQELEEICLQMLSKDPRDRFPSCRAVYDRLQEFLEGSKERERRQKAAQAQISGGEELAWEYHQTWSQATSLQKELEQLEQQVDPWEALEKKRPIWRKRREYSEARRKATRAFGEAQQKYVQALGYDPGSSQARKGLADLYWSRLLEAEEQNDELDQITYRELVRFYDDGTYAEVLKETGLLSLHTQPGGVAVSLWRFQEEDCRLVPVFERDVGYTPVELSLPLDSYLLRLQREDYRDVWYPVCFRRGEPQEVTLCLYHEEEIGGEYIYIPGGPFPYGGDPEAPMSLPLRQATIDDFFISRYPVTFWEYLEFLNDLHRRDPEEAAERIPRSGEEKYACLNEEGLYLPDRSTLFHGAVAERYPPGEGHEWRLPILGVSWFDAILYCRWRSQREGRKVTLPTEVQWEKAAAGADRRIYPWGNEFDATFCKMARSRPPDELQPEPVATFPHDESPYGVRDLSGTISEWTLSMEANTVDALSRDPKITAYQRGGGWIASNEKLLRIRARGPRPEGGRSYNSGFRVVVTPTRNR